MPAFLPRNVGTPPTFEIFHAWAVPIRIHGRRVYIHGRINPVHSGGQNMRRLLLLAVVCGGLALAAFGLERQTQQRPPAPNADPYANNAAPGSTAFPLAAPAGKDSNARA